MNRFLLAVVALLFPALAFAQQSQDQQLKPWELCPGNVFTEDVMREMPPDSKPAHCFYSPWQELVRDKIFLGGADGAVRLQWYTLGNLHAIDGLHVSGDDGDPRDVGYIIIFPNGGGEYITCVRLRECYAAQGSK